MAETLIRFLFGGLMVSAFALLADLLKPKTAAGLLGAAPSVALASLILTVLLHGKAVTATSAQAMTLGAVALLLYAWGVGQLLLRAKLPAAPVSLLMLLAWLVAAIVLWSLLL